MALSVFFFSSLLLSFLNTTFLLPPHPSPIQPAGFTSADLTTSTAQSRTVPSQLICMQIELRLKLRRRTAGVPTGRRDEGMKSIYEGEGVVVVPARTTSDSISVGNCLKVSK